MKRFLVILLTVTMLFSLTACKKASKEETPDETESTVSIVEPVEKSSVVKDVTPSEVESETQMADTETEKDEAQPGIRVENEQNDEDVSELLDITAGVREDGEDIINTMEVASPYGDIMCEIVYHFEGGKLSGIYQMYYLPNEEQADLIMDTFAGDPDMEGYSVEKIGSSVKMTAPDSLVSQFAIVTRETLLEIIKETAELEESSGE